ncbi:MAG: DUF4190 domain-containing protein [bacterium]
MSAKKEDKKQNLSYVSYTLGILSIVMAFFQPLAGIVIGIIGLIQSKDQKTSFEKKAKKLNTIGIILGIILFISLFVVSYYLANTGTGLIPTA